MKKLILTSLLGILVFNLSAQNLERVKDMIRNKRLDNARTEIDKIAANEKYKKNAEVWYTKAKVYAAIADDSTLAATVPNAREEAFNALKDYLKLDTKQAITLQLDQFQPLLAIYQGYFREGANAFNDKKFDAALEEFKRAGEVSTLMADKGWSNVKLDTTIILYSAVAAQNARKDDEAAKYYQILADNKVATGEEMADCYKWLADYFYRRDKPEEAQKYLTLGKELFPNDGFWASMELDMLRDQGDKNLLFSKYEEVIRMNPGKYEYPYNYALELYDYGYKQDVAERPENSVEIIARAEENMKKALELNPASHQAMLVIGQINYNRGVDLQNEAASIKSTAAEDTKKRAELRQNANKYYDAAIPYLEKVYTKLDPMGKLGPEDRNALKNALDILIIIYDQKNQKEKVKELETIYNNVESKHS
ncbi:MAG TPA: hypothetical protein VIK74_00585 [Parasegetibacter sp.]